MSNCTDGETETEIAVAWARPFLVSGSARTGAKVPGPSSRLTTLESLVPLGFIELGQISGDPGPQGFQDFSQSLK